MNNLLDSVLISPAVYQQWIRLAQEAIGKLPRPVDPLEIGDEDAERRPDGSLLIFATYKGERVCEMIVPREQWTWRFPRN
jgi:hypothetical protein